MNRNELLWALSEAAYDHRAVTDLSDNRRVDLAAHILPALIALECGGDPDKQAARALKYASALLRAVS